MNYEEFKEFQKNRYHFLLSDLNDEDIGFVIEFMRLNNHINSLIFIQEVVPDIGQVMDVGVEDKYDLALVDNCSVLLVNYINSILREGLRLFYLFYNTKLYKQYKTYLEEKNDEELEILRNLEKHAINFNSNGNQKYTTEKKDVEYIRNLTFHYDPKIAKKWCDDQILIGKSKNYSFDITDNIMVIGKSFDEHILSTLVYKEKLLEGLSQSAIIISNLRKFILNLNRYFIKSKNIKYGECPY